MGISERKNLQNCKITLLSPNFKQGRVPKFQSRDKISDTFKQSITRFKNYINLQFSLFLSFFNSISPC